MKFKTALQSELSGVFDLAPTPLSCHWSVANTMAVYWPESGDTIRITMYICAKPIHKFPTPHEALRQYWVCLPVRRKQAGLCEFLRVSTADHFI